MTQYIYDVAESHLGVKEYPAAKHNPTIIEYYKASGHSWVQDDETPWCAAFVGAVLAECGMRGTNELNARSYMKWGQPVDISKAQKGDVVVFWRGSPNSWKGHVAFFSHTDGENVWVLGGNQGNAVSLKPYPMSRLLGVRAVKAPRTSKAQSKTIQASIFQLATAAGTGVSALASLDGTAQLVTIVGAVVVAVAAMFILKERILKWNVGDR